MENIFGDATKPTAKYSISHLVSTKHVIPRSVIPKMVTPTKEDTEATSVKDSSGDFFMEENMNPKEFQ
jgi:hypothetical protein